MPSHLSGNAADAPRDSDAARFVPAFGVFGKVLVDGFGERVGLAVEVRARRLIGRLHRHHPDSAAHSIRVAELTMAMWRAAPDLLGDAETALLGSLLHDIGKLCVPREILASPRLLTVEERAVVSSHASRGAELLLAAGFPEPIAAVARGHHERWSGGGYPSGRPARGEPTLVQAVAVADAFDAMTDPSRTYRAPLSRGEALREVAACAGTHFDPVAARILAESLGGQAAPPRAASALLRRSPAAHRKLAAIH